MTNQEQSGCICKDFSQLQAHRVDENHGLDIDLQVVSLVGDGCETRQLQIREKRVSVY